ncbi:MAG TPA: GNAT family N-acetyltransferase [Planctomycetota bacterium]|nr:GNAT family N-acetyltransferase [Planctomycetota bacterium]
MIRHLKQSEVELVTGWNSGWIPSATFALTVYGCRGYAAYVHALLELPEALSNVLFFAYESEGSVQGYAEWRIGRDSALLNTICVHPDARNRGTGRGLLRHGVELARGRGRGSIVLDVLRSNARARQWYERLGFAPEGETLWLRGRCQVGLGRPEAQVLDLPQADAAHNLFGFSSFRISTPRGEHVVGRLGEKYFRLTDTSAVDDTDLHAALAALDPVRELFLLAPARLTPVAGFEVVDSTTRLRVDTSALGDALAGSL